jgi:hypothetical protein
MAIFSQRAIITERVGDLIKRWERAKAFYDGAVHEEGNRTGTRTEFNGLSPETITVNQTTNIIEVNEGGIRQGYLNFIEQEKKIRDVDNERKQLEELGSVALPTADGTGAVRRNLDVPALLMLFQQFTNLTKEAEVAAETEEIRQQNNLLADYNRMQNIVNETLKKFTDTGEDASKEKENVDGNPNDNVIDNTGSEETRTVSMFEDALSGTKHPIEVFQELPPRPTHDTFNNSGAFENDFLKTAWQAFGTQLSDAVSTINQNTQIKMNDINSLNREKNRHFDLANNALRKMADTVQNIARAI